METLEKRTMKIFYSNLKIKFICVGNTVLSFETKDTTLNFSSEHGLKHIKLPYAYGKEINYFMLHQKYIPIQEYKTSMEKNEYQYL